eukprot:4124445-Pyramimonas_sp.AAC.1
MRTYTHTCEDIDISSPVAQILSMQAAPVSPVVVFLLRLCPSDRLCASCFKQSLTDAWCPNGVPLCCD